MLLEFGWSTVRIDLTRNYLPGIEQPRPAENLLATCFSTPCFPAVGSSQHLAQLAGGDPWYGSTRREDEWLDFTYGGINEARASYRPKYGYNGALSYVTGTHSIKVGMDVETGTAQHGRHRNGELFQIYSSAPNTRGLSLGFMDANCSHFAAAGNILRGLPCGTTGIPNEVEVWNDPSLAQQAVDYNGGVYAQDSWTIDRLTLNYGLRMDFASTSTPAAPRLLGRFVNSFEVPHGANIDADGNRIGDLPSYGPDWSPRLSVAYDLFGDARTALKLGWNKYVRRVGVAAPERYSVASAESDIRDWFDCQLNAAGTACAGDPATGLLVDDYGGNFDDIAQNWEIGLGQEIFGTQQQFRFDPDNYARENNTIWTAGIQQEITSGLSISAEFRRRAYHNTWGADNLFHNMSDFGALPDGSPDPAMAGTGRYFDVLRPYPMVGSFTMFAIDPAVRLLSDQVDRTRVEGYTNVYKGSS